MKYVKILLIVLIALVFCNVLTAKNNIYTEEWNLTIASAAATTTTQAIKTSTTEDGKVLNMFGTIHNSTVKFMPCTAAAILYLKDNYTGAYVKTITVDNPTTTTAFTQYTDWADMYIGEYESGYSWVVYTDATNTDDLSVKIKIVYEQD